jgi:hypothetical protein
LGKAGIKRKGAKTQCVRVFITNFPSKKNDPLCVFASLRLCVK